MQMVHHAVDVHGPSVSQGKRSPEAVGTVLTWIEPLVRESVSMAFRYTSSLRGRRPEWLVAASTVRLADISGGTDCTRLHFEAPRFGEAAADLYQQRELFDTRPREDDTGFDLIGDIVTDIACQSRDSLRFDAHLLRRLERFGGAGGKWGVQSLALHGDRLPEDTPLSIDSRVSSLASALCRETPPPQRGRIAGRLDMIRASDGSFSMILDSQQIVRGVWVPDDVSILADSWGKYVVVEGPVVFRPSGALLRIEAEGMVPARDEDLFFSVAPEPAGIELDPDRLHKPQSRASGVGAVFGKWPGEETEEEILATLKDLS